MWVESARKRAEIGARLEQLWPGLRAFLGETDGLFNLSFDIGFELAETVGESRRNQLFASARERVALLAVLELGRRAVFAGIAHRVAPEAVRPRFDERRFAAGPGAGNGVAYPLLDVQH